MNDWPQWLCLGVLMLFILAMFVGGIVVFIKAGYFG